MRKKITHFSLAFVRRFLEKLPKVFHTVVPLIAALLVPVALLWKIIRPLVLQAYKTLILIRQRIDRFFHAQHKVLALVSHKYTAHLFMTALVAGIVSVNIVQAREVRAEQFIDGSIIDTIINPNADSFIETDFTKQASNHYINTSATVRAQIGTSDTIDLNNSNQAILAPVASAGKTTAGAVATTAMIAPTAGSSDPRGVEQYTVQPGETISTIAAKFGVTTQTILTVNNLTDEAAKRVKSGDQIYILRTSGIAHTVKSGETAEAIAKKYEASAEDIIAYNKLINGSDLEAGTEIIVPGGTRDITPPPAPVQQAPTTRFAGITRSGGNTVAAAAPTTAQAAPAPAPAQAAPAPAPSTGGKFTWPTTTRRISQYFGYRHTGLDIDGEFGDPIYAANSGRVIQAGWSGGYGIAVVIDHGGGITTRYAHLQRLYVSAGQNVSKGQTLGEEGSTGNSTGAHLHYEVMVNGRFVNPFSYH